MRVGKMGQSMAEYVVLFLIVAAAFTVMYQFAMRAVNGRMALFSKMVDTSPSSSN